MGNDDIHISVVQPLKHHQCVLKVAQRLGRPHKLAERSARLLMST